MAASDISRKSDTSIFNSLAVRGVVYQVLLALAVGFTGWYLYYNANANLERQGIATGFSFLNEAAGFGIGESIIPYDAAQSYGRALLVGILNTLHVAIVGVVLATSPRRRHGHRPGLQQLAHLETGVGLCRGVPEHSGGAARDLLGVGDPQSALAASGAFAVRQASSSPTAA